MDSFFQIQAAWMNRDLSAAKTVLTPEFLTILDEDLADLKAKGRVNRLENIAVRQVELIEAWQEFGKEFATVRFYANLVDYTIEEATGKVVDGDKSQPAKFEEFWTMVRETGSSATPWRLSAVEKASVRA